MPQGNAQSIDSVNAKLKFTSNAQAIDSINADFEILSEGFRLLTPATGEINVTLQPTFSWQDPENRGLYRLVYSLNQDYSNSTKIWTTGTSYTPPSNLDSGTYYWKVEAQTLIDRPPIVPDEEVFSGMVVWNDVLDPAPIYVYDQAPPRVMDAANELATHIATSSGKTEPSITEVSDSFNFPSRSIKIGFPNSLTEREEIQIKCSDGGSLELTGVDEFDPQNPDYTRQETETNFMKQAGTYHAVYTFIHDYLGVVYGWIGELGTAVPSKSELKVDVVDYTHTPSCLSRHFLRFSEVGNKSGYGIAKEWLRKQRQFYSVYIVTGHELKPLYRLYHPDSDSIDFIEDRQEIFALQPDGTRDGYPYGDEAKFEDGEPLFDDLLVDEFYPNKLLDNPLKFSFSCAGNDGFLDGHSVDPRALAMDYPPAGFVELLSPTEIRNQDLYHEYEVDEHVGEIVEIYSIGANGLLNQQSIITRTIASNTNDTITLDSSVTLENTTTWFYQIQKSDVNIASFRYSDRSRSNPVLTDRKIRLANRIYEKFKVAFPNLYFAGSGVYGFGRFLPKEAVHHPDIFISNVSNSFSNPDSISTTGDTNDETLDKWLDYRPSRQLWRPNLGSAYGHKKGMAWGHITRAGARLKDVIGRGVEGFLPDVFWEHWSTQWHMYYLVAQLLWDHTQNVDDIMDKAYNTLFGDASPDVKAYYETIETHLEANKQHSTGFSDIAALYSNAYFNSLQVHIDSALTKVVEGSIEHDRLRWVNQGLGWMKRLYQSCEYFVQYNAKGVIIDSTDIADTANAIESDIDAITGWSNLYSSFTFESVASDEPGFDFAFYFDGNDGLNASKGRRRDEPLPEGTAISGTLTSGDTITATDTSLNLTESQAGRVFRVTAGTNAGEQRGIESNTTDQFTFTAEFNTPLDNTSEYEIVDMYLVSIDAKHTGVGDRWVLGVMDSNSFNESVSIQVDDTELKRFEIIAYGGDQLKIRETDDRQGAIYVYNMEIKKINPVDKVGIANEWNAWNNLAISEIENSEWYDVDNSTALSRPIGHAAIKPYASGYLPTPDSSDITDPEFGLE